ncbi:MAG: thioredoxin domain-containing protein [Bdellovibrionales bacterium]|nr:thioredoxin domain-containing protein [Bdellovibrionales bacterium]
MTGRYKKLIFLIPPATLLAGCVSSSQVNKEVAKSLEENPELLFKVIEKNPEKFFAAVNKATQSERARLTEESSKKERELWLAHIESPMEPKIRTDEAIRGAKNAPLQIVIYSDFQCSFCMRGAKTVKQLMEKYEGKVQVVYKHLPLPMHPQAMIAAKYYEGLRKQNPKLAFQFHDRLFKRPDKIEKGETYLRGIAKILGADLKKLEKDIQSTSVQERIDHDVSEAKEFGFNGTPAFVVNGVPLTGAQPLERFDELIQLLKEKKNLKI